MNELNNEIELLQEHIGDIQTDMGKFKQEAVDMDEQREIILEKLKVYSKYINIYYVACSLVTILIYPFRPIIGLFQKKI